MWTVELSLLAFTLVLQRILFIIYLSIFALHAMRVWGRAEILGRYVAIHQKLVVFCITKIEFVMLKMHIYSMLMAWAALAG